MFDGALRAIAVVTSATIALSFVLFAAEKVSDASKKQQTAVVDPGPQAEPPAPPPLRAAPPRRPRPR